MIFFDAVPVIGLLVLALLFIARVRMLKALGIPVRSKMPQNKASRFLLYPLFVAIGLVILMEIVSPLSKSSLSLLPAFLAHELFDAIVFNILGTAMVLAALVLFFITLRHFNDSLRIGLDENNLGKLITSGVFSLSRNPLFLSIELYFIGVSLLIPNIFFLSIALLAIVAIHLFILKEEKFMLMHYGDEYRNYTKKTPRYLRIF